MNVGSLFTGIGGFDLGLERAGMHVMWQCEPDNFCRRVLAKHWPDVPCFQDVRVLSRAAGTPPVDVLCGGFPCQDISVAGRGAGIRGARSGLWSEYARLIGELEPRWVVVENVSALLGRGLSVVLADLAALGYDAEWDCIPASAVGAPHRRDRVWIVAYPQRLELREQPRWSGPGRSSAPLIAVDGAPRAVADADETGRGQRWGTEPVRAQQFAAQRCGEDLADAEGHGRRQGRSWRPAGAGTNWQGLPPEELADAYQLEPRLGRRVEQSRKAEAGRDLHQWSAEPDVGRVAHGVLARVDRLRALGNALVPQIAEWIGERIMSYERDCL